MVEDRIDAAAAEVQLPLAWFWSQHWLDVLFLHWRVSPTALHPHIPPPLEVQTYDGDAWVSLVLFRLKVRPRGLPFLPGFSNLQEANLRTYVQFGDQPGIWFLDVLADNRLAMQVAKLLTPMPYRRAAIAYTRDPKELRYDIRTRRRDHCRMLASFQPGPEQAVVQGSLDAWLLERYRLYIRGRRGLMHADVAHPSWIVRDGELTRYSNAMGQGMGLDLCRVPDLVHFSSGVKARFGAFRRIDIDTLSTPRVQAGTRRS